MRFVDAMVVLGACVALGCSGAGVDPLGDGGSAPDAADDHKAGVALDAGADSDPVEAAVCPYPAPDANDNHSVCYPVPDSLCGDASACGTYKYHYACGPNNAPPTSLNCLSVGNDDFCCGTDSCVEDVGNPITNCTNEPHGYTEEIACPPGAAPPTSANYSYNDAGVGWFCVPPQ